MSSPRKLYVENFELTLVDISNDISHDISEVSTLTVQIKKIWVPTLKATVITV